MTLREVDLLKIYEQGLFATTEERAYSLLSLAWSFSHPSENLQPFEDTIRQCGLHDSESHLLSLRTQLFGPDLFAVATCPHCKSPMELGLNSLELVGNGPIPWNNPPREIEVQGLRALWRQPVLSDLLEAASFSNPEMAKNFLLQTCILSLHQGETSLRWNSLAPEEQQILVQALESEVEKEELLARVTCPQCGQAEDHGLNAVSFLWGELSRRAKRILREVHDLARYYGWSETDILSLSPARRQIYLEMAAV